ncbi:MAG: hypothetical protein ACRDV4_12800 [Acidimicrobiales bacterium]
MVQRVNAGIEAAPFAPRKSTTDDRYVVTPAWDYLCKQHDVGILARWTTYPPWPVALVPASVRTVRVPAKPWRASGVVQSGQSSDLAIAFCVPPMTMVTALFPSAGRSPSQGHVVRLASIRDKRVPALIEEMRVSAKTR